MRLWRLAQRAAGALPDVRRLRLAVGPDAASVSRDGAARFGERGPPVSAAADRGLLLTLLELARRAGEPTTSGAIADAAGIPAEYAHVIRQRLEANRDRGLVGQHPGGGWQLTAAGLAAAGRQTSGHASDGEAEHATPAGERRTAVLPEADGILPGVPFN